MSLIIASLVAGVVSVLPASLRRKARRFFPGKKSRIPSETESLPVHDMALRLAGAVKLRTVSYQEPDPASLDELASLHKYLHKTFPLVHETLSREVVGGYSLLYTWKGTDEGKKAFLLMAHMDVVAADSSEDGGWTHPPFDGRIANGYVWGRGTLDYKQGVTGILEAVEALIRTGFAPDRTVYLAFGHDEEVGGLDGASRIAGLLASRGVRLEFVLDEGLSIVEGFVPIFENPMALVGIAEKGYLSVEMAVEGEGGHSSMPPERTVVGILARAVDALEQNPFKRRMTEPVLEMFESVAGQMPLALRVVFSNLALFKGAVLKKLGGMPSTDALIRTTTAVTIFEAGEKENILPAKARAVVNFRLLQGDSIEGVLGHVRSVVGDPRVAIRPTGRFRSEPSPVSDTSSQAFRAIREAVNEVYPGVRTAPSLTVPASDSRHYAGLAENVYRFVPLVLRPEDVARFHGVDERVSLEGYAKSVRFYMSFIRKVCGGMA